MQAHGKRKAAQPVASSAITRPRRLKAETLGLRPTFSSPAKDQPGKLLVFPATLPFKSHRKARFWVLSVWNMQTPDITAETCWWAVDSDEGIGGRDCV